MSFNSNNRNSWTKPRHKIIRELLSRPLSLYLHSRLNVSIGPPKDQDRQYLILFNHQTVYDQFFVSLAFKRPVYFITSEDLFSNGLLSRIMSLLVAPVPIRKQMTDPRAVKQCARIAREGGTIAVAPEGNRTYSGRPVHIKPSIVKLIRLIKMPIAVFLIKGGYGVLPRWSDRIRRGRMTAEVSRIIEPEEYESMSADELYGLICRELYTDEEKAAGLFENSRKAEYIERAVYVCPDCGLSRFESSGNTTRCTRCGQRVEYTASRQLKGIDKPFPFRFAGEWYDYQEKFVNGLDLSKYTEKPMFTDTVKLYRVKLYDRKYLLKKNVSAKLFGDRIELEDGKGSAVIFRFDETELVTVLGRNKLNIYTGGEVFQFKGDRHLNSLKYVNIFFRYRNTHGGNGNDEFLGL